MLSNQSKNVYPALRILDCDFFLPRVFTAKIKSWTPYPDKNDGNFKKISKKYSNFIFNQFLVIVPALKFSMVSSTHCLQFSLTIQNQTKFFNICTTHGFMETNNLKCGMWLPDRLLWERQTTAKIGICAGSRSFKVATKFLGDYQKSILKGKLFATRNRRHNRGETVFSEKRPQIYLKAKILRPKDSCLNKIIGVESYWIYCWQIL